MISIDAYNAIAALNLDRIKMKLMHVSGENWSQEKADAVEVEYRRFLYLIKVHPDAQITPLVEVDQFWHCHILDTMKYAQDCEQAFGYFVHHHQYSGMEGTEEDSAEHQANIALVSELYEETFGAEYGSDPVAYGAETVAAFCGVRTTLPAAFCGVRSGEAKIMAAFCGAPSIKAQAAFCGAPSSKAQAAFCGAPSNKVQAAFCGAPSSKSKAAFCGAPSSKAQAAFCGAPSSKTRAAFCGAPSRKVQAAFCGAPSSKATAAFCGVRSPQSASAFCGLRSNELSRDNTLALAA